MLQLTTNHVQVMGILNVTPDSFSDGGQFYALDQALYQTERLIHEGANIIDIGGESTRPGAEAVPVGSELERVIPVLQAIKERFDMAVSIDTSKAAVMQVAIQEGADMINDVRALQEPDALAVCAQSEVALCLMHMQGRPRTMQQAPYYENVVQTVLSFFRERIAACEQAGIAAERIVLDPGFGFGKTLEHNATLLRDLPVLAACGRPLLVGLSRKSMIGAWTGNTAVEQRVQGSVAAAVIAAVKGAKIVRVHDVAETVEALKIVNAIL